MRTGLLLRVLLIGLIGMAGPRARKALAAPPSHRPTLRQFMGLNTHTVGFKPELYRPTCQLVRDYHPVAWDIASDPAPPTTFPLAANRVDWGQLYGGWNKAGYNIDACLMFNDIPPDRWKDSQSRAYGRSFAQFFGPTHGKALVSSVEIGNEPSNYSEAQYRAIFEPMAQGIRAGDPKLTIATCAVMTGKTDQWSKQLSSIAGLEDLYDVLNIHSYAFKDKWPTWRRSYPEDPSIRYLKDIADLAHWRDEHAPGKQIWLTEFGYDSSTKPAPASGEWSKWVGVTDEQQAQYTVRSFLVLSAMPVDRAYLYFFNDNDEPKLHAASGITRNFHPKPSFYAMSHLYKTLGDYRFVRAVIRKDGDAYCFEYERPDSPAEKIYVAWLANGANQSESRTLDLGPASSHIYKAQQMPLAAGEAALAQWKSTGQAVTADLGPSPLYLWAH